VTSYFSGYFANHSLGQRPVKEATDRGFMPACEQPGISVVHYTGFNSRYVAVFYAKNTPEHGIPARVAGVRLIIATVWPLLADSSFMSLPEWLYEHLMRRDYRQVINDRKSGKHRLRV
jgi:hypothetical protein